MGKLAIQGNATRGSEVIALLEMLGGTNSYSCNGLSTLCAYYIIEGNIQVATIEDLFKNNEYILYSLEGILSKFPYKVGDKVYIYVQNDDIDGRYDIEVAEITSMRWNPARGKIAYKMKGINREFYKEEIKCKVDDDSNKPIKYTKEKKINQISLANCDLDKVEIVLGNKFELKVKDGKYYAVKKKSLYPKNYEECCDILSLSEDGKLYTKGYKASLIQDFHKLLICRNAYWEIAGEQMGLGKSWKPDWKDVDQDKYVIYTDGNTICTNCFYLGHNILAFPTKEMRDIFYENFKDLIEQCKELL